MADDKKDEDVTIVTYIGRRYQKGKIQHCFRDEDGSTVWWPKVKSSRFQGAVIGREYRIGSHLPTIWRDVATEAPVDEKVALAWQAADRQTEMIQRQKNVDPSPELTAMVEGLRLHRLGLSTAKRVGFDAWVLNAIR